MRIAFFEDSLATNFAPLALTRPVFELLCGQFSARERGLRFLDVTEWGAFVRSSLADVYKEEHPEARVNDWMWLARQRTLLINGRWLATGQGIEQALKSADECVGRCGNEVAFMWLEQDEAPLLDELHWDENLARLASTRKSVAVEGVMAHRLWDLIDSNSDVLCADISRRPVPQSQTPMGPHVPLSPHTAIGPQGKLGHHVAILGDAANVFVDPTASIDPFVVIDARQGPVFIDVGVKVQAFTRLEGPCHIGAGTQLFRANIKAGTSIGPVCRIGGEIEASIIHGYSNKYHDGFLGHSYVGSWVNLGALTSNSDLKNDYSNVKVPVNGELVDSGSPKVGCFIGDHTKTAIGTLFNTGSSIGVMAMVLPGGELCPKHIPSFCRVWHGGLDEHFDLESGITTASRAMGRRNKELTAAQNRLLRQLHQQTADERQHAFDRQHAKRRSHRHAEKV